ncbi:MAG: mandelate racemase/muconate lactonizing enzyme family protein, partial [Chloroflexi bacterium]|nr:mandelate racemase/muconate lactonizing enzyme family protein [Chloroflexota bacterium]
MAQGNRPVALEFALWDLLGKACGQPVYRMLGGYKDAIKAYCSTGSVTDAGSHIDFAHNAIERGYRAIKLRMHRATVDDDLAVVRAVRDAVGDRLEIMADANQAQNPYWTRADALRAARGLQELGASWLEEPLAMHDAEGLATVAGAVDMP